MDIQHIIDDIYEEVAYQENNGELAAYIPELSRVDSQKFGVCMQTVDGDSFMQGDCQEKFSIQSIAKVLSLSLAFSIVEEPLWDRVDVEPSGTPFNSLIQLETEAGIPRNPFINAGALVVCDVLCSYLDRPKHDLLNYIRKVSQNPDLTYDVSIASSEYSRGYRNFALANFLKSFGNLHNDVEKVIDLYFNLCSIKMTCEELARSFLFLANRGRLPGNSEQLLRIGKTKRINAIMQTCGFYDEAGEFAYRVGLPGKSGVGGGIVAVMPKEYCISVWSPRLNPNGNSYRGMKFLEQFTTDTESSIF